MSVIGSDAFCRTPTCEHPFCSLKVGEGLGDLEVLQEKACVEDGLVMVGVHLATPDHGPFSDSSTRAAHSFFC